MRTRGRKGCSEGQAREGGKGEEPREGEGEEGRNVVKGRK